MPPLMTMPSREPERLKMLDIALKERQPRMHENLRRDGDLMDYLKGLDRSLMESYDEESSQIMHETGKIENSMRNPIKHAQRTEMMLSMAWEKILHNFLQHV